MKALSCRSPAAHLTVSMKRPIRLKCSVHEDTVARNYNIEATQCKWRQKQRGNILDISLLSFALYFISTTCPFVLFPKRKNLRIPNKECSECHEKQKIAQGKWTQLQFGVAIRRKLCLQL